MTGRPSVAGQDPVTNLTARPLRVEEPERILENLLYRSGETSKGKLAAVGSSSTTTRYVPGSRSSLKSMS